MKLGDLLLCMEDNEDIELAVFYYGVLFSITTSKEYINMYYGQLKQAKIKEIGVLNDYLHVILWT